jgi:hypothetical protein
VLLPGEVARAEPGLVAVSPPPSLPLPSAAEGCRAVKGCVANDRDGLSSPSATGSGGGIFLLA